MRHRQRRDASVFFAMLPNTVVFMIFSHMKNKCCQMENMKKGMRTMKDNEILEKGYHQYAPGPFDSKWVMDCFQKRFRDEKGTKYFIDIRKWEGMTHPHTGEYFEPSYDYWIQLYRKEKHDAVDLEFHSEWTLDAVEEYVETLFQTGLFDYYELDD